MELYLKRVALLSGYTIGHLYQEMYAGHLEPLCDTLEPGYDASEACRKGSGKAIKPGRYALVVTYSPQFNRYLPLLLGVPGREGIRIHAGNTAKDTRGCILPGWNRRKGMVINSRSALQMLIDLYNEAKCRGEGVWMNVE